MAFKLEIVKRGDEIKKKCSPLKLLDSFLEKNHPMTISSKFSSY
jgi:hypothetical protein